MITNTLFYMLWAGFMYPFALINEATVQITTVNALNYVADDSISIPSSPYYNLSQQRVLAYFILMYTLLTLVPQLCQQLELKASKQLQDKGPCLELLVRFFMFLASFVNLHNILLVFTCVGDWFEETKKIKKWMHVRHFTQIILSFSLITMISVTNYKYSPECVVALVLMYVTPFQVAITSVILN